jgi:hypothetical protein
VVSRNAQVCVSTPNPAEASGTSASPQELSTKLTHIISVLVHDISNVVRKGMRPLDHWGSSRPREVVQQMRSPMKHEVGIPNGVQKKVISKLQSPLLKYKPQLA